MTTTSIIEDAQGSNINSDEDISASENEEIMESESNDGDDDDSDNDKNSGKSGWADAMAKVLNTKKDSNEKLLLTKARKDYEVKKKDDDESNAEESSLSVKRSKKKEMDNLGRCKPDIVKDRAKERTLNKLATKGVVQLFNAVRAQQKDLKTKLNSAGKSTSKREKVFKNIDKQGFLENVLGGAAKVSSESVKIKKENRIKDEIKNEPMEEESTWNILRDDYMMGAKMKDWDKNSDSE